MNIASVQSFINAHVRLVIMGLSLVALGIAVWFAYGWYHDYSEQQAHKDFSESVEDYHKLVSGKPDQQAWHDLGEAFALRAKKHGRSSLAPYFLAYQAEALLAQDKREDAAQVLEQALKKMSKNSPMYYAYASKLALVKLDAKQEEMRAQGKKELEQLSQDSENPMKDMALYYEGYAAFTAGDMAKAEAIWKQLFTPSYAQSVWTQLASTKLQGLA